jgi:sporulation protein YlmC with PRC-barrel domain
MTIMVSELYGKKIITNTGQVVGMVEEVIVDLEEKRVANLLLTKMEELVRTTKTAGMLQKNSVKYDRVKSVAETIIVTGPGMEK